MFYFAVLKTKKTMALLLLTLFLQSFAFAYNDNGDMNQLKDYAVDFFNKECNSRISGHKKISLGDVSIVIDKERLALIKDDIGNYVVLTKSNHPKVIGYSLNSNFNGSEIPPSMLWFLDLSNKVLADGASVTEDTVPSWLPDHIAPFLNTTWNQGYPYNAKCPQRKNSRGEMVTCPTGCVATAMAQIMAYYKYPECGCGVNRYSLSNGMQMELDFETINFDWENMLNHYDYIEEQEQNFNETEADAVSNLMFACGVSANMEYLPNESAAGVTAVEIALKQYFKYDQAEKYEGKSNRRLGKILFNISKSMPVLCASSYGSTGKGHAVILDGYDTNGNIHVNWGWGGHYDGFYNIFALTTSGGYSMGSEQIIADIKPPYYENHVDYILSLEVNEGNRLSQMIREEDIDAIEGLKIIGKFNVNNFSFIREMTDLYYLDLSEAQLVDDQGQFSEEFPEGILARVGYDNNLEEVILPNSCTVIGEYAFGNRNRLKSVTIGNNVTEIKKMAFGDCEKLESINIPEGVTKIATATFERCSSLRSIYIPESVTWIGDRAFSNCKTLETTNIPNIVSYIGESAFEQCKSLSMPLVIGDDSHYTSLGDKAFYGCEKIPSVKFIGRVSIDHEVFWNCSSLSHVEFSEGTFVNRNAIHNPFCYCPNLTSVVVSEAHETLDSRNECNAIIETKTNSLLVGCKGTVIPSTIKVIGESAFQGCSKMASMELPESVKEIGYGAFQDCSMLESIKLSDNLTEIGGNTFRGCLSLKSIYIPRFVKTIGEPTYPPFPNCPNLKTIIVDEENVTFDSRNYCNAIIETKSNSLRYGCVNSIIPNSVTSIGNDAFKECITLTSINIPSSVTCIEKWAFQNCSSLTSIKIPSSITTIGDYAFYDCSLSFVVSEIENPFYIEYRTFGITDPLYHSQPNFSSATLYVPFGTKTKYENTLYWNQFPNIIEGEEPSSIHSAKEQKIEPMKYYSLDGKQISHPSSGLYIIKYTDGSVNKVFFSK